MTSNLKHFKEKEEKWKKGSWGNGDENMKICSLKFGKNM